MTGIVLFCSKTLKNQRNPHITVLRSPSILPLFNGKYKINPLRQEKPKYIRRRTGKRLLRHAPHGLGMDTVMPEKTAQKLAECPNLTVASLEGCVLEVVSLLLQGFKAPQATFYNSSRVICRHSDFSKIVVIDILCMLVHFPGSPGRRHPAPGRLLFEINGKKEVIPWLNIR